MGEMAAALAHELNQPLTAVANWAEAARRLLDTDTPENRTKALDFMDKAIGQADRAGQIIRRLRNFVGKGDTEARAQDPNALVEEATALALVGGGAREHGVRVVLELGSDLPAVLVDKVQIQQVVINLVRNAIEAMAAVAVRQLTIATSRGDGVVDVSVLDTGPGLAPEVAEQLFQPFVTTKRQGMGIGLSICRSIIDKHGGRLRALPRRDGGMIFSFTIPIVREEDDPMESQNP
jgi:two-component system sensor kinase FixL